MWPVENLRADNALKDWPAQKYVLGFRYCPHKWCCSDRYPLDPKKGRTRKPQITTQKKNCGLRIKILSYKFGHSAAEILFDFNKIVNHMSEGLEMKSSGNHHDIDSWSKFWMEIKSKYADGYQGDILDLVVLGCYSGARKYKNTIAVNLCTLHGKTHTKRCVMLSRSGSDICYAIHD